MPSVIVTTPEAAKGLIITNGDSLKGSAPHHMADVLGSHFLVHQEGDLHSRLRKRLMKHLQPESLKALVPGIEELAQTIISSWSNGSIVTFVDEIERVRFTSRLHNQV